MAREFLFFALESAFGVPMTPTVAEMWTVGGAGHAGYGVAGFTGFYMRLDENDSFTVRPKTQPVRIQYGGGFVTPVATVNDKIMVEGTYKTKLWAGPHSQFLLTWACQQINSRRLRRSGECNFGERLAAYGCGGRPGIGFDYPRVPT